MNLDRDPTFLRNNVQFDLRFYMCHRCNENFQDIIKNMITVKIDEESGLRYVMKQFDKKPKNHQQDQSEVISADMTEIHDCKSCPVASFVLYVSKLDKYSPYLWLYPKKKGKLQIPGLLVLQQETGVQSNGNFHEPYLL